MKATGKTLNNCQHYIPGEMAWSAKALLEYNKHLIKTEWGRRRTVNKYLILKLIL